MTEADFEARLAAIEARLGPAPQAVPPVTIGELTDVPAPGSPIASPWAQETTNRIMHRFVNVAERDAKWPAAVAGSGALCVTTGDGTVYVALAGLWNAYAWPQSYPWIAPTMLNSWVAVAAGYLLPGYRKIGVAAGDMIQVRGQIKSGSAAVAAFTLPAGYRPPATFTLPTDQVGAYATITVTSGGDVRPSVTSTNFSVNFQFSTLP
jgi:hypothetical protein